MTREFLIWAVGDAMDRGEIGVEIGAPALVEVLLLLLCGTGFYAGYLRSHQEMQAVTETLRRLLQGALTRAAG